MRKTLLLMISALVASLALASSASAAPPPEVVVCGGPTSGDGTTYEFSPYPIEAPLASGFGLFVDSCLVVNPAAIVGALATLGEIDPGPPPEEPELPDEIPIPDPDNPLSALNTISALCSPYPALCQELISAALFGGLGAVPIGNLDLQGTGGSCNQAIQRAGGSLNGGGSDNYDLDFDIDYRPTSVGGNLIGQIDGTGEVRFGDRDGELDHFQGLQLPNQCGGSGPGLVILLVS